MEPQPESTSFLGRRRVIIPQTTTFPLTTAIPERNTIESQIGDNEIIASRLYNDDLLRTLEPSDVEIEKPSNALKTTGKVLKSKQTLTEFLQEYNLCKHQLHRGLLNIFRRKSYRKYYVNYPEGYFVLYIDRETDLIISKKFCFYKR